MKVESVIFKEIGDKVDYQTFISIVASVKEMITDGKGDVAADYYETLRLLVNSENNAGWQDRHSQRIELLNTKMGEICDEYEEYLP